jgi:hypothetical protein
MPFAPQESPDRQITGITPDNLKVVLEELEAYNLQCRLFRKYDQYQKEIPIQYRGINRYWWQDFQESTNEKGEVEHILAIYDNNPEFATKTLLVRYRIEDENGMPMTTIATAEKHIQAARLEYDRQQRMAAKNPTLSDSPKITMPVFHTPTEARRILDAQLNP